MWIAEVEENASEALNARSSHLVGGDSEATRKGRERKAAERAAWPPVRQPSFVLGRFHKALLNHYGIKSPPEAEPATVPRLRLLLRRAGVSQPRAQIAVGCTLARYLELNPGWALWHLTAAALETFDLSVADAVLSEVQREVE